LVSIDLSSTLVATCHSSLQVFTMLFCVFIKLPCFVEHLPSLDVLKIFVGHGVRGGRNWKLTSQHDQHFH